MRLLILAALFISSTALAGEFAPRRMSFAFVGDNQGNRIYFKCSTAIKMVEEKLALLGAQNIQVKCEHGLETWTQYNDRVSMPITAKFDVPTESSAAEAITLEGDHFAAPNHSECFFMTKLLDTALPLFPGVKIGKHNNACVSNYSYWFYHLQVSK